MKTILDKIKFSSMQDRSPDSAIVVDKVVTAIFAGCKYRIRSVVLTAFKGEREDTADWNSFTDIFRTYEDGTPMGTALKIVSPAELTVIGMEDVFVSYVLGKDLPFSYRKNVKAVPLFSGGDGGAAPGKSGTL